jgi:hypothetical protein
MIDSIFFESDVFFNHFLDQAKFVIESGDIVPIFEIATYSTYLNVTEKGGEMKDWDPVEFPNLPRQIVDVISPYNHRILVGIPVLRACTEGCVHCINQHNKVMHRYNLTRKYLKLNMRFRRSMHMKYYYCNENAWTGGMNFTTGATADVILSLDLQRTQEMSRQFQRLWADAEIETDSFYEGGSL